MFPKHPSSLISRSNQVRRLWAEFETWHSAQREQVAKQVSDAHRDLDAKWRSSKPKKSKKELEQQKSAARSDIEKSFDGNRVREEWDNRLSAAGLRSDEWDDITEEEQRRVERILGADLDLDDPDTTTVPDSVSPLHSSSFLALPLTHDSRSSSTSDTYAIVDPHTFNMLDENSYDSWQVVKQRHRSDDEDSLDASTASSFGWGASSSDPAYASWSSEISRSSTQSSQTSSPEQLSSKHLAPDYSSLLASASKVLFASQEVGVKSASNDRVRPHTLRSDSSSTLLLSQSSHESTSESRAKAKGKESYVGPHLTDSNEVIDEEAEFEKFKMSIRIQKIREFHTEAADADICLTLALDEARRSKKSSKEEEARRVQEHETQMLELRKRKEQERKALVDAERQKRRAELRQRSTKDPSPSPAASSSSFPTDPPPVDTGSSIPQHVLKALQGSADGSHSSNASDTPTIRQTARRQRKQSLQTDWTSGNDTPTPTNRTSGWMVKQTGKPVEPSGLAEAPPLKRLATAPASTLHQSQQSTLSSTNERGLAKVSSIEESALFDSTASGNKKSKPAKSVPEPTPAPSTSSATTKKSKPTPAAPAAESVSKKAVVQPTPAPTTSSKTKADTSSKSKKKGKTKEAVTESETEGASSSKQTLEQMPSPDHQLQASKAEPPQVWGARPDVFPASFTSSQVSLSTLSSTSSINLSTSSTASSSTSSINLPNVAPQPQLPDNRRVWMPPSAAEINLNKRPIPTRKMTLDPPVQLEKSVSGTHEHTSNVVPGMGVGDEAFRRARRLSDPVSPSPRSFDFPTTSAAAPVPAPAPEVWRNSKGEVIPPESATTTAAPSSILKKTKDSTKSSSKKKGKKKVTIEEVEEESEEMKGAEKLPVDSRFIMEPKPVVPQAAFSQIFEYGTRSERVFDHVQEQGSNTRTSSSSVSTSTNTSQRNEPQHLYAASANPFWSPSSNGDSYAEADSESMSTGMWNVSGDSQYAKGNFGIESMGMRAVSSDPRFTKSAGLSSASTTTTIQQAQSSSQLPSHEKHVRWRPSALEYEVDDEVTGEDVFLSALDSLEAIVRGSGDHMESEADLSLDSRLSSSDVRAGAGGGPGMGMVGRKDKKGRGGSSGKERDGEEAFWQHAITSLGGRGGASVYAI